MGQVVTCFGQKSTDSNDGQQQQIITTNNKKTKKDKIKEKSLIINKEKQIKENGKSKFFRKEKTINSDVNDIKSDSNKANTLSNGNTSKSSSAKVRPMTPSQVAPSDNIPKPIAFEITVDDKTKELTTNVVSDGQTLREKIKKGVGSLANAVGKNSGDAENMPLDATNNENGEQIIMDPLKLQSRFPRRLPKLSSLGKSWSINHEQKTNEEIIEKQKKAEEKRNEILESKKQKARKFVEKFTSKNSNEDDRVDSDHINGDTDNQMHSNERHSAKSTNKSRPNSVKNSDQQLESKQNEPQPSTSIIIDQVDNAINEKSESADQKVVQSNALDE